MIAVLLPCVLAALRNEVGTDFQNYYYYYSKYSTVSLIEYIHLQSKPVLGIWLFSRISGAFNSFNLFLLLFSVVTYIPVAKYLIKHSKCISVGLASFIFLLTIFTSGLNIMKQTVAISFVIISLDYVKERNIYKFLLTIFIACQFHITAVSALILYFIKTEDENRKMNQLINSSLISFVVVVSVFADKFAILLGEHYVEYFQVKGENTNKTFFISVCWFIIFLALYPKLKAASSDNRLYLLCVVIGLIFGSLGFSITVAKRIAIYFSATKFLLESQIPRCSEKYRQLASIIIISYEVAYFVFSYVIMKQSGVIPYNYKIWDQ